MKSNQGIGSWIQYVGAAVLLALIGYVLFQMHDLNKNVLRIPAVRANLEAEENESLKTGSLPGPETSDTNVVSDPGTAVTPILEADNTRAAESVETNSAGIDPTNETSDTAPTLPPDDAVESTEIRPAEPSAASVEETVLAVNDQANGDDANASADLSAGNEAESTDGAVVETETSATDPEVDPDDQALEQVAAIDVSEPGLAEITFVSPSEPEFDLVRLDASGSGIVAGRADPGTTVRVLSNGIDIGTAEASSRGEFVAFVHLPENDEGQSLSLEALGPNVGSEGIASTDQVLVLPNTSETEEALAPTIVKASNEEVRVIQPGGLGQIDGVSLDSISYDESGDVVLSGRGRAGDSLRIYVDNSATSVATVSSGGTWESKFSSVEEGRYILRVDALDEAGKVNSRVESPFQRIFPTEEQLATPNKITVQPGQSLWLMATERYGSGQLYTQIYAANKDAIRDPDLIFPGQIFDMPSTEAPNN